MRYKIKSPIESNEKSATRFVPFESEGVVSYDYGFEYSGKVLYSGFGAEPLKLSLPEGETPTGIFALNSAQGRAYMLICASGKVYFQAADAVEFSAVDTVLFTKFPTYARVYDSEEGILFSDGVSVALFKAQGVTKEQNIPAFVKAAYYYERLWIIPQENNCELRFSAPMDIRDFSAEREKGGVIRLPDEKGDAIGLCCFENYLYVFRERGVQRLAARGDENEFEFRDEFTCAKIYGDTIAESDGKMFFLAEDGLHCFGTSLQAFSETYSAYMTGVEQTAPCGVAIQGNYVLKASLRTENGEESCLVIIRTDGSGGQILRIGVSSLTACEGDIFFVDGGILSQLVRGAAVARRFVRELENPLGDARLKDISLRGKGMFLVTFTSVRGKRTVFINSACESGRVAVNLCGERFICEVCSEGAVCELSAISVRFCAQGGNV